MFFYGMPRSSRSSSAANSRRSSCPLACSLDLLGDRWTLLVIRDLFSGKSRYGEFLAAPEGIPTNILADRLQRLEKSGLIKSAPYQQNPPRYSYTLTAKGLDLKPVLAALAMWAMRHLPKTQPGEDVLAVLRS
jgi:DNA-binding HxlR family transcriptional regulator